MISALKSKPSLIVGLSLAAVLGAGGVAWTMKEDRSLKGRKVDYHKIYDVFWDVACDTAMDGSDRLCYVQYVDVYRPRPDFAAAMVEVVVHKGDDGQPDPHVRFDIEPGLSFQNTKIAIETGQGAMPIDVSQCKSNTCRFSGDEGREILALWRQGSMLSMTIDEGREELSQLSWPMQNINTILDDFATQRVERGLP